MDKKFKIVYRMYTTSDALSETTLHAKDEAEAKRIFERIFPNWTIVSIKLI